MLLTLTAPEGIDNAATAALCSTVMATSVTQEAP
jgi:hypothetical protein